MKLEQNGRGWGEAQKWLDFEFLRQPIAMDLRLRELDIYNQQGPKFGKRSINVI